MRTDGGDRLGSEMRAAIERARPEDYVMDGKVLSRAANLKLVLLLLAAHAGGQAGVSAWPSQETLAEMACLSRRAVQLALAGLKAQGWVEDKGRGPRNVRLVALRYEKLAEIEEQILAERLEKARLNRASAGAAGASAGVGSAQDGAPEAAHHGAHLPFGGVRNMVRGDSATCCAEGAHHVAHKPPKNLPGTTAEAEPAAAAAEESPGGGAGGLSLAERDRRGVIQALESAGVDGAAAVAADPRATPARVAWLVERAKKRAEHLRSGFIVAGIRTETEPPADFSRHYARCRELDAQAVERLRRLTEAGAGWAVREGHRRVLAEIAGSADAAGGSSLGGVDPRRHLERVLVGILPADLRWRQRLVQAAEAAAAERGGAERGGAERGGAERKAVAA